MTYVLIGVFLLLLFIYLIIIIYQKPRPSVHQLKLIEVEADDIIEKRILAKETLEEIHKLKTKRLLAKDRRTKLHTENGQNIRCDVRYLYSEDNDY